MGVVKLSAIALDYTGIDSILLDPVIPEMSCFKHDEGASLTQIIIGNPDADNSFIGDTIPVLP